jgi:hypothetical protein
MTVPVNCGTPAEGKRVTIIQTTTSFVFMASLTALTAPIAHGQDLGSVLSLIPSDAHFEDRSSQLIIANSTNATLTIQVLRAVPSGGMYLAEIDIPPLSEGTIIAPGREVQFTATAGKTSQQHRIAQEFFIQTGRSYEMNLTPQMFGTSFLTDPTSADPTGITTNESKVATNGGLACSESDWDTGKAWYLVGPSGSSAYYESGGYLCRATQTGFCRGIEV